MRVFVPMCLLLRHLHPFITIIFFICVTNCAFTELFWLHIYSLSDSDRVSSPPDSYYLHNSMCVQSEFHLQPWQFVFLCHTWSPSHFSSLTIHLSNVMLDYEWKTRGNTTACLCVSWITDAWWPITDRLWRKWCHWSLSWCAYVVIWGLKVWQWDFCFM